MPDVLIRRIDGYVRESGGVYKDRSHFSGSGGTS
nr:hypothetical protein K4906_00105 [Escherichia coli]